MDCHFASGNRRRIKECRKIWDFSKCFMNFITAKSARDKFFNHHWQRFRFPCAMKEFMQSQMAFPDRVPAEHGMVTKTFQWYACHTNRISCIESQIWPTVSPPNYWVIDLYQPYDDDVEGYDWQRSLFWEPLFPSIDFRSPIYIDSAQQNLQFGLYHRFLGEEALVYKAPTEADCGSLLEYVRVQKLNTWRVGRLEAGC